MDYARACVCSRALVWVVWMCLYAEKVNCFSLLGNLSLSPFRSLYMLIFHIFAWPWNYIRTNNLLTFDSFLCIHNWQLSINCRISFFSLSVSLAFGLKQMNRNNKCMYIVCTHNKQFYTPMLSNYWRLCLYGPPLNESNREFVFSVKKNGEKVEKQSTKFAFARKHMRGIFDCGFSVSFP